MHALQGPYSGNVDFNASSNANSSSSHQSDHFSDCRAIVTDTTDRCQSSSISTATAACACATVIVSSIRTVSYCASTDTSSRIYGIRYE